MAKNWGMGSARSPTERLRSRRVVQCERRAKASGFGRRPVHRSANARAAAPRMARGGSEAGTASDESTVVATTGYDDVRNMKEYDILARSQKAASA